MYGDLALGRSHGASLVFHALTGSAEVESWWGPVIGPGKALGHQPPSGDRRQPARKLLRIIGPERNHRRELPFAHADGSRARPHAVARALGISRLVLVTGGSLGGMVALQWGLITPVPVERLVVFAAPARTSAQAIAWNVAQRMAIEADPAWAGGRYPVGQGPAAGLAAARSIAMITYRSVIEFEERFGRRESKRPGQFDVEYYLRRHGEKLVARFDARSYVALDGGHGHPRRGRP